MTSDQAIIQLEKAWKSYHVRENTINILKDINLKVYMGRSLAVIGPSGAGKSTLLHILGLLTSIDQGTYFFNGHRVEMKGTAYNLRIREQIGYIFQDAKLIPDLNLIDNICVPLVHRGIWQPRQKTLGHQALDLVGLVHRADHKPNQLSGGELMRAAIARAIVTGPNILLADEPTGSLDSLTAGRISDLLLQLVSPQCALVIATHNEHLAYQTDLLLRIIDGQVTCER